MEFWGRHEKVLGFEQVAWGSNKIGPGPQPIKTDKGWLIIYHGAETNDEVKEGWNKIYRLGVMLCDLENPAKVIALPPKPLLSPEMNYEKDKFYRDNIVFPSGVVVEEDNTIKIYYGASDNSVCVAETSVDKLLDFCLNPEEYEHPVTKAFDVTLKSKHA